MQAMHLASVHLARSKSVLARHGM